MLMGLEEHWQGTDPEDPAMRLPNKGYLFFLDSLQIGLITCLYESSCQCY